MAIAPAVRDSGNLKRVCKVEATVRGPSKNGTFTFIASTPTADRAGDIIEANWDLAAFERNPVILYAHDYGSLPVGRAERVWVDGPQLMIEVRFVPREIDERAWQVQRMYEEGYLHAVSVGFRPIDWTWMEKGGMRVTRSELLEVSCVPVPMNAEALATTTRGAGIAPVYAARANTETRAAWRMNGVDEARVKAWLEAPIAKGVIVKKMDDPDDPEHPDPEPASETPIAAKVDEILALLQPKDGTIGQSEFDQAIALLNELKAGAGTPDDDAQADPPTPDTAPGKALVAALTKAVTDAVESAFDRRAQELDETRSALVVSDDPENAELEAAFASPEFFEGLKAALAETPSA